MHPQAGPEPWPQRPAAAKIAPMLTVHHLEHSRSHRILWLLEELGLQYTLLVHRRDPKTLLAPDSLRAVHPLGKSPLVVEDGEVLAESGAIVEILHARHGQGRLRPPPGTAEDRRCTYWLHFAEGSAMPPLVMDLVFARIRSAPMPFFAKPIARALADKVQQGWLGPQVEAQLDTMEAELARGGPYFAGQAFSLADLMMGYPVDAACQQPERLARRPRLAAWQAAMHARPAYRQALRIGGPLFPGMPPGRKPR